MITRDGACTSLWQDTSTAYKPRNAINSGKQYDVIIAGGGITGISTGLLLQKAGLQCAVLEANSICFGTTGGTTAHLNTIMDTPYPTIIRNFGKENAALVARAAREAINLIKSNIAYYDIDCDFKEAEAGMFSQNKNQTKELEEIHQACTELGVETHYIDIIPAPFSFEKALCIDRQAKFHPVRYVMALADAFERAGGVIVEHCRVKAAENNEPLTIETSCGEFRTGYLIYATHIPPGVSLLNLRCAPYRTYAMAVTLADHNYPAGLIYDMCDPYHYYRSQEIDGQKYLLAGGEDHKTAHEENTLSCFLRLENHLRSNFAIKEVAYRWSSQYFEPVDGLPYIGHMPGQPGKILVATGFGGNGMIYSNVAAGILTDIVLQKENPYTLLFDPNRVKPVAGFSNFVKENTDVLRQFIGRLASHEELTAFAGIAPGEGRLVKFEGHFIGLSKDEQGNLHAVYPACTHMKCHVAWNNAEKSWDCPCHGARYDADGRVLTGPADMDLEEYNYKQSTSPATG